jgi:hypothetical protein
VFRTDDGERRHDGHGGHGGPGPRREREDQSDSSRNAHLYNPDGTLRDPKRSAYYHPEYNPFGVPPPGMPYRERCECQLSLCFMN